MCSQPTTESLVLTVKLMHMLCFNFIFSGLNFIFLSFKLIIINYHTQKYNTFKLRIKLNHKVNHMHNNCMNYR